MFTRLAPDNFEGEGFDLETGDVRISHFANAVQVWALAQARDVVTVDEAAAAFNVTPEIIREAVDHHGYMFLDGDNIEHDGD